MADGVAPRPEAAEITGRDSRTPRRKRAREGTDVSTLPQRRRRRLPRAVGSTLMDISQRAIAQRVDATPL
jgi:hypothetical protein